MKDKILAEQILKLLDCRAADLENEIYRLSQIVEHGLDYETFTGFFDSNGAPISVGDYVVRCTDSLLGRVFEEDNEFFVEYGDTFKYLTEELNDIECVDYEDYCHNYLECLRELRDFMEVADE